MRQVSPRLLQRLRQRCSKGTIDYMVHLGDYIYEEEGGAEGDGARAMDPPRELTTLYDYRTRIGLYRTDEDLLLSHQQYPWITTWVSIPYLLSSEALS